MPSKHDPSLGLSLSYGENDDNERAEVSSPAFLRACKCYIIIIDFITTGKFRSMRCCRSHEDTTLSSE